MIFDWRGAFHEPWAFMRYMDISVRGIKVPFFETREERRWAGEKLKDGWASGDRLDVHSTVCQNCSSRKNSLDAIIEHVF